MGGMGEGLCPINFKISSGHHKILEVLLITDKLQISVVGKLGVYWRLIAAIASLV
jgi:hypothetical protein